jgi:hypothetical protein
VGSGICWPSTCWRRGERVLDVPPKLSARVRLLATGAVNKNDPNDARPVAAATGVSA